MNIRNFLEMKNSTNNVEEASQGQQWVLESLLKIYGIELKRLGSSKILQLMYLFLKSREILRRSTREKS
jgi:hypothetical protein